jgi:very-short-patch-repair endonuclease
MAERGVLLERAALMRREPTHAEKILWRYLSGSKLGGHKFRRQAIIGNRICDFFCPAKGLIVEVDGQTHDRESDLIADRKMEHLTGFRTVRVTNEDVITNMNGVLELILEMLEKMPDRWSNKL